MAPRLVALDDGVDIVLDRAMIVVGRHPQCDARLDSLRVSRHHCCMTVDQGAVLVRDLGSTNGIRINGHRVEYGRLQEGDELSIAHIRYRLAVTPIHEVTLADGGVSRNGHSSRRFESSKRVDPHPSASYQEERISSSRNGIEKGTDPAPDSDKVPPSMEKPGESAKRLIESLERSGQPSGGPVAPLPESPREPLPWPNGNVPMGNALADAVRHLLPPEMADRCQIQVIVKLPEVEQAPGAEKLEACQPDSPL